MDEKNEIYEQKSKIITAEAELVWDEYKYRHEHCWKAIFQLTSAAVLLGVIPYLGDKLPKGLDYWLLSTPILAVFLIGFAMLRIQRELSLLSRVKSLHRQRQSDLYNFCHCAAQGTFDKHIWWYLRILFVLATANVVISAVHLFR
jgi:hypothetical protein